MWCKRGWVMGIALADTVPYGAAFLFGTKCFLPDWLFGSSIIGRYVLRSSAKAVGMPIKKQRLSRPLLSDL